MTRLASIFLSGLLVATVTGITAVPTAAAQPALPGAPSTLQAVVDGNNLTLTWAAPSTGGAPSSYTLVARAAPGGAVLAAIPLGNTTAFSAVGPNGVYVVSLVAVNASGAGPESAAITITLPTLPAPPGPPTGLVASAVGSTASFIWTPPSSGGAVGNYVLMAGLTPGFAVPIASLPLPASAPGTVVPGVPPGTYYIRVVAQNSGGVSAPSNEAVLSIAGPTAPGAPTLNPAAGAGSTLNLSWTPGGGGAPTSYLLTALAPGGGVLATLPLTGSSISIPGVPNGTYVLQIAGVNAVGTGPASNQITVTLPITGPPPPIAQLGADITSASDNFGFKVALSANGQRLAVASFASPNSGATRVYERTGNTWTQIGADILGEAIADQSGISLSLNAAGTRLAIGADRNDGGGSSSGHVRVYDLAGSTWTQVGADLDGGAAGWLFGFSVALSASGDRLIASGHGSSSTTGYARVFDLVGSTWTQVGPTMSTNGEFGYAVDISADGTTIAVSAPSQDGEVYVYRMNAGTWVQVGNVLLGDNDSGNFGDGVSLSANGSRLAVAAPAGGGNTGKVSVFDLVGSTWTPVGNAVIGVTDQGADTVALSDDGTRFAVVGNCRCLARVYGLTNGTWTQIGSDITNPSAAANVGLALSADGRAVAVGFVAGTPKRVRVFGIAP